MQREKTEDAEENKTKMDMRKRMLRRRKWRRERKGMLRKRERRRLL